MPVAFIDWDSTGPGNRLWDLGYLGWTWCIGSLGNIPITDQARRLRQLRDAYGDIRGELLLAQVVECQTHTATTARALLEQPGRPTSYYDHHRAAIAWAEGDRALVNQHAELFLTALQ